MVYLFVGRFVEKKGLAVLRRIATALPDSLFVMLGQGPVDPGAWGLDNVRVVGAVDQQTLARYYQSADLLVLPSVGEGLPLVVQEAMSAGLPAAVSSRTARADSSVTNHLHHQPCTDELGEDEVVGRWVAMLATISPESTIESRRALRCVAVERWSWESCAARYAEIFEGLLR
jgi:glycosyltransferase involved in cell wall biosynthesis